MLVRLTEDNSLRPLEALRAVQRLVANPDDTRQVFIILRAMRGRSGQRMLAKFRANPVSAAILDERRSLLEPLQDQPGLAALPDGSLGRAYLIFMQAENLSAQGLAQMSESPETAHVPEEMLFIRDRVRDTHDLGHVVTGYGRDPLGELCLLAFNFAQNGHLGMAMIVAMGMLKMGRAPNPRAGRAAVIEGWRRGRKAAWLGGQDWEALLAQPLDTVRKQLGLTPPQRYVPTWPG